jgi:small-conductance mechanosensitive channel
MIGKNFIIARGKTKQSKKIYGYVASVHYGLLALALLIASQQFGIEASILALFGAVGFGLGLALQEHSPIYLLLWCC